jgi:hypothetical protein
MDGHGRVCLACDGVKAEAGEGLQATNLDVWRLPRSFVKRTPGIWSLKLYLILTSLAGGISISLSTPSYRLLNYGEVILSLSLRVQ